MENIQLSKNFWLYEFIISQTAQRRGIDNTPPPDVVKNLKLLCDFILQPTRDFLGSPIFISSGFRCLELNHVIRGAAGSQHTVGKASDIKHSTKLVEIFNFIRHNLPFDQLIWEFGDKTYPGWVHASYTPFKRRAEVLRAYWTPEGTIYDSF